MIIDVDELREDMKQDCYGDLGDIFSSFFGGGFGGALMEASDIESASPEELVRIAQRKGIDLSRYEIK